MSQCLVLRLERQPVLSLPSPHLVGVVAADSLPVPWCGVAGSVWLTGLAPPLGLSISSPSTTQYTHTSSHTHHIPVRPASWIFLFFILSDGNYKKKSAVLLWFWFCFKELNGVWFLTFKKPLKVSECLVNPLCFWTRLGFKIYFNYPIMGLAGKDELHWQIIIQQTEVLPVVFPQFFFYILSVGHCGRLSLLSYEITSSHLMTAGQETTLS